MGQETDLRDTPHKFDRKLKRVPFFAIYDVFFEGTFNDIIEGKFTYSGYFSGRVKSTQAYRLHIFKSIFSS